ncbi:MAG: alkaline phosphatase family protein [Pseudomonadota bacterium]
MTGSTEVHLPDYDGRSIVNLMASLAIGLDAAPGRYRAARLLRAEEVAAARHVVLIVVDGLGYEFLQTHSALAPNLMRHLRGALTSVFPSTTAAGVGSFMTGMAPVEHGLTGWHVYLQQLDAIVAVLPGFGRGGPMYYRDSSDVHALLSPRPFVDRLPVRTRLVSPRPIANSPFNTALRGTAELSIYDDLRQMFELTLAAVQGASRSYVYSYWPDLDSTAHRFGMGGDETLELLVDLDRRFGEFAEVARSKDALIVLTADHGHINTGAEVTMTMNEHPEIQRTFSRALSGEPRAAYAAVVPEARAGFAGRIARELDAALTVVPSRDAYAEGWFGPGPAHAELLNRIGDFILLPAHNAMVRDWVPGEKPFPLASAHGGLSSAEMYVPVICTGGDATFVPGDGASAR